MMWWLMGDWGGMEWECQMEGNGDEEGEGVGW
jgi:hypothetical protein